MSGRPVIAGNPPQPKDDRRLKHAARMIAREVIFISGHPTDEDVMTSVVLREMEKYGVGLK